MPIDDKLTYNVIGCRMEVHPALKLEDVRLLQENYLSAFNFDIGLLINVGSACMEYKGIFRSEKSSKSLHQDHPETGNGR